MKLLLDSTYLMPEIVVSVKDIPQDIVAQLLNKHGFETEISNITIFELEAKGAKYIAAGKLDPKRVTTGIMAILNDNSIERIDAYANEGLNSAFKLRSLLNDFIDCLIVPTALTAGCDALVT